MTNTVFITGDRAATGLCECSVGPDGEGEAHLAFSPATLSVVLLELFRLAAEGEPLVVVTGEESGIDTLVKLAVDGVDAVELVRLGTPVDDEGKPDFESRALLAKSAGATRAIVIHGDPLASRVGKATLAAFGDDAVSLVGPSVVA